MFATLIVSLVVFAATIGVLLRVFHLTEKSTGALAGDGVETLPSWRWQVLTIGVFTLALIELAAILTMVGAILANRLFTALPW